MNSADKLRNIVKEALRNFSDETGLFPKVLAMDYVVLQEGTSGVIKGRTITHIEIVFEK
jgi:hypothetical protein